MENYCYLIIFIISLLKNYYYLNLQFNFHISFFQFINFYIYDLFELIH